MSVISIQETWEGRTGALGRFDNSRIDRSFLVKTNSRADTQLTVSNAMAAQAGIVFLTPHPEDESYTARTLTATQKIETPLAWTVVVSYSTEPLTEEQTENEENPLLRPTRIRWASESIQKFAVTDKDGDALTSTANVPFNDIEVEDVRWSISMRKNFATIPVWVTTFVNSVNETAFAIQDVIFPPRTVKMSAMQIGELQQEGGIEYYEVEATLSFRPDTWDARRANMGFLDSTGKLLKTTDGSDAVIALPLDADGLKADPTAAVIIRTFRVYAESDFNDLPF